jgi:hypothetical protein
MSEGTVHQVNPGGQATDTGSADKKDEEALLQAYMQALKEKQDQGVQLPTEIVPTATTSQDDSTQPVQVNLQDTEMPRVADLKRKAENYPEPDGGKDVTSVAEQPLPVAEKPLEPEKKVPRKDVPQEPAKLTPQDIAKKTVAEAKKLTASQLAEGIEMSHLVKAGVSREVRDIIRPLIDPSVRKQQQQLEEKKQQVADRVKDFNAVKGNIQQAGDWFSHYNGTAQNDIRLRRFMDRKGYTPQTLIERVVGSSRLAEGQYCAFRNSDRANRICEVVIDLGAFFEDEQMHGMNIAAGITDDALEVFHLGPGG